MRTSILSLTRFTRIAETFHKAVSQSPVCVTFNYLTTTTSNTLESVLGENTRSIEAYKVKALFKRDFSSFERQKQGLTTDTSAVIYTSPKLLKSLFNDYKIDPLRLKIELEGEKYLVKTIIYQGQVDAYNSCICVEIRLVDDVRGG